MRADLHLHTNASDGALAPAELLRIASARRLDALAITDHDSTAGYEAALSLNLRRPRLLPALEISCLLALADGRPFQVDVLAYAIDHRHPQLRAALQELQTERRRRARAILKRLQGLGLSLQWRDITALATGESIGRPHIARALVAAGYARSIADAFARYLRSDAPAYEPRWRHSAAECIALIHAAGGVAILAHPGKLRDDRQVIRQLLPLGLDGIEIIHPAHDRRTSARLRQIAGAHSLLQSGGSDFHRADEAGELSIGRYLAPPGAIPAILERAASRAQTSS